MKTLFNIKSPIILWVIIIVATLIRLVNLASVPPHLTSDEAALGYNAYSILKTGKDEYGQFLPVTFKSFGDYKPGLYVYTAIPFVAALGLTEFAVRLPSAVSGIIAIFLIYKITLHLTKEKKYAVCSALLLAINPWHIHFSRGAWEINLALTLTLAGIYYFFHGLKKQKYLPLSALLFGLTLLAYQGAKLSSGIVIFVLVVTYWKEFWSINKKILLASAGIGVLIAIPIIMSLFTGKAGRLAIFSVFSYPRPETYLQDFLQKGNETVGSFNYVLYHSETLNFLRGIFGRYFNHFSGRFLFFEGDWQNLRHSAPNHGMFVVLDMLLIAVGIYALVRYKDSKTIRFIILWLLLSPLPSVLSRDQVHAVRGYNMLIPLIMISSWGAVYIFENLNVLKFKYAKHLIGGFFMMAYILNYIYFLDAYFVHLPKHQSKYWEYGYREIVNTITPIQNNYSLVRIQQSYAQPYIFFLFYQKYDPAKYQAQAKLVENSMGDVGQVEKLDNIIFAPVDWSVNRGDKGTLIVGDLIRIPEADSQDGKEFKLIKKIDYLDGEPAFKIIEIKND